MAFIEIECVVVDMVVLCEPIRGEAIAVPAAVVAVHGIVI